MERKLGKVRKLENDFTRKSEISMQSKQTSLSLSKRRKRRIVFILAVFMFFACIFAVQIIRAKANLSSINTQLVKDHQTYQRSKMDNQNLNYQVQQLSNKSYVEKVIRDRYYYTKPGETVYSFPDSAPKDITDNTNN